MIALLEKEFEIFVRDYVSSVWDNGRINELKEPYYLVHYYYPFEELFEKVFRLTSKIGENRFDKNGNHRLDAIALTKDDYEYFEEFCSEASDEVYKVLFAYMDNSFKSYFYDSKDSEKSFVNSVHYIIKKYDWVTENSLEGTDKLIKKSICDYIIFKWFSIVLPEEATIYYSFFEKDLEKLKLSVGEHYCLQRTSHPF